MTQNIFSLARIYDASGTFEILLYRINTESCFNRQLIYRDGETRWPGSYTISICLSAVQFKEIQHCLSDHFTALKVTNNLIAFAKVKNLSTYVSSQCAPLKRYYGYSVYITFFVPVNIKGKHSIVPLERHRL